MKYLPYGKYDLEFFMIEVKWFPEGVIDSSFTSIRKEVFVKEQGVDENNEFDELDKEVPHLVIFEDSFPVATGRIIPYKDKAVKLGRIAVIKEKRGQGFGEKIVLELIEKAKQDGATAIYLGSQAHAVGFYEKCGFELLGTEMYLEEGIEHFDMVMRV